MIWIAVVCGLLGLVTVTVAAVAEIVRECLELAQRESEREGSGRLSLRGAHAAE